jgi:hypothetical protein
MDRVTDRIEQHIDYEREMLRSNLEELEDRVRSVVDWRRQFRSNPATWLGLAFGGGLLIGLIAGGGRTAAVPALPARGHAIAREPTAGFSDHWRREISLAWRGIESALIGVAGAKLKDTLAQVLPGFREQLARRKGDGDGYRPAASARYHS